MPCVHMLLGWAPMLPSSKPEQVDLCLLPLLNLSEYVPQKQEENGNRLSCSTFTEDTLNRAKQTWCYNSGKNKTPIILSPEYFRCLH